jgi:hypothetical protein
MEYGRSVARSEPLAIVWDKRRILPAYVQDFRETLVAHMREHRSGDLKKRPTSRR